MSGCGWGWRGPLYAADIAYPIYPYGYNYLTLTCKWPHFPHNATPFAWRWRRTTFALAVPTPIPVSPASALRHPRCWGNAMIVVLMMLPTMPPYLFSVSPPCILRAFLA